MSELRWDPTLEEWVITATHRQDRTYKPPRDYCPLCPTREGAFPTEVPEPDYEIVVFENKFPSLKRIPPVPAVEGTKLWPVEEARGVCEVVLYTPNHNATLADSSVEHIEKLVAVWADRYAELGSLDYVDYVLIFENKGDVIGVTLSHPHGQIYAFPFIPPKPSRELASARKYKDRTRNCLYCDILKSELDDGRRMVAETRHFAAFVPFYAHYPYEVHVIPKRHEISLSGLCAAERRDLALMLKVVMKKYDGLFGFSLPYIMIMHQAPTNGGDHSYYHFHVEFCPPNRTADKLKYLAGCESGAGTFINDTLPEEKAVELRDSYPNWRDELGMN